MEKEFAACVRASLMVTATNRLQSERETRRTFLVFKEIIATQQLEMTEEIYSTHSRMRWAVSVASVRGLRVVLRMLLLVRYIMLQTCTGERRPAPGPLTTTATSGPIGAKTWTHGCWLTAVETSHCCTGLEGRLDRNNREKEKKFVLDREWEREKRN